MVTVSRLTVSGVWKSRQRRSELQKAALLICLIVRRWCNFQAKQRWHLQAKAHKHTRFSLVSRHVSAGVSSRLLHIISSHSLRPFSRRVIYLRDSRSRSNNRVKQSHGSQPIIQRLINALRIFTAWPHFTSDLPFGSWKNTAHDLKENTRCSSKIVCLDRSLQGALICIQSAVMAVGFGGWKWFNPYSSGL